MTRAVGKVLGIALRGKDKREMREVAQAACIENGGIEGDPASSTDRGITLIATGHWKLATRELGVELPWWTRRANVLVDCESLGELIGSRIRLGEVEVLVCDETRPCGLMDELHPGLRAALKPDRRAGVHGRIVQGGTLKVGATVSVLGEPGS